MTGARLPSALVVTALIRRVNAAGGFAMLLRRGEETGGVILIQAAENGVFSGFYERMTDFAGQARLESCGPGADAGDEGAAAYRQRRAEGDPDLWIVELDIAEAKRFAAETILMS